MSPIPLNVTVMMLKSLLNCLFVLCCVFSFSAQVFAQSCNSHATVVSPPINAYTDPNDAATIKSVICNNAPLTLVTTSLSNCPSCTYLWSDGTTGPFAFAFTAGTYSVTVTDNAPGGCVGVSTDLNITATNLAVPQIAGDSFNMCYDLDGVLLSPGGNPMLEVSNPCPTCTYQWYQNNPVTSLGGGFTSVTMSAPSDEEYYVEVTSPAAVGSCVEQSRVIDIGISYASKPPVSASSTAICDTNTSFINTIDCPGCSYEWFFYDYFPDKKLIITAVFDGTRPGGLPKGIELQAQGNIADLSEYSIGVGTDAGATGTLVNFPAVSLLAGEYFYFTNDYDEFTEFFGFNPNFVNPVMNMNGNDRIELYHNGVEMDIYGDHIAPAFGNTWDYNNGWALRDNDAGPTVVTGGPQFSYDATEWNNTTTFDEFNVDSRDNDFFADNKMSIGTYTANQFEEDQELIISGVYAADFNEVDRPSGVQLYAVTNIPDLSAYSIQVMHNGGGSASASTIYTFPAATVLAGEYIYLTDSLPVFDVFFGGSVTSNPLRYESPILDSLDGDDAVLLLKSACSYDETNTITPPALTDYNYTTMPDVGGGV